MNPCSVLKGVNLFVPLRHAASRASRLRLFVQCCVEGCKVERGGMILLGLQCGGDAYGERWFAAAQHPLLFRASTLAF